MVISSIGSVLKMTGYENYLAIKYHSGPPLCGNHTLRFKILDANKNFSEIFDEFLHLYLLRRLRIFVTQNVK